MEASFTLPKMALVLLLSLSILLPSSQAAVLCEDLPRGKCAFAISASSKRCVLESAPRRDGTTEYQCRTSEVLVERISDWIETDYCVRACGVDRNSVGISSDSLLEAQFGAKLCSPDCYRNCPNIVDLYFNLAAGEGVFLPDLCNARRANPHRSMIELLSSGAAPGPVSGDSEDLVAASPLAAASAPAPSPTAF